MPEPRLHFEPTVPLSDVGVLARGLQPHGAPLRPVPFLVEKLAERGHGHLVAVDIGAQGVDEHHGPPVLRLGRWRRADVRVAGTCVHGGRAGPDQNGHKGSAHAGQSPTPTAVNGWTQAAGPPLQLFPDGAGLSPG